MAKPPESNSKLSLRIAGLFTILLVAFMFLDIVFRGAQISEPALAGLPSKYNVLAYNLYAMEVFALIALAVILSVFYRKRYGKIIFPWVLTGLVAVFLLCRWYMMFVYPDSGFSLFLLQFPGNPILHYYNHRDFGDQSLQSLWGVFLLFQLPFLATLSAGYALVWQHNKKTPGKHLSTKD
jgi:hypothetical protein